MPAYGKGGGLIENDLLRWIVAAAVLVGVVALVVRNNRAYSHYDPARGLLLSSSPKECIRRATAHMAEQGYSVAHAGDTTATYTRPKKPDTATGIFLLLFGLIPGLLYFGLFRGTATSTLVAVPDDDDETRLIFSGDDVTAQRELFRWAHENL